MSRGGDRIIVEEQWPAGPALHGLAGNVALLAVFLAHLGFALLVGTNHEPWRDEADIWFFTRDASPLTWWTFLRHSGHPGLWHLFVAALSNSNWPYASMTYLNVAIVSAGVAIFLRWALLPLPLKVLLPFGVLPLFEYGVVARSYGLSFTLSIWVVGDWKPVRTIARALADAYFPHVNVLLGGLLGFGLSAICVALMVRRRGLIALLLASVGGLSLVFVFVFPPQLRHAGFLWIATTCMLWLERRSQPSSIAWRSLVTWLLRIFCARGRFGERFRGRNHAFAALQQSLWTSGRSLCPR